MLVLSCKINIGRYTFSHVNHVKIDSGRSSLDDKAIIRLPQKYDGQYLASVINQGDPVEIYLGYDGEMKLEFTGYVTTVNPNIPVEIVCIDAMYQLKREKPTAATKTGTLKEVIEYLVPGVEAEVPVINLKDFKIDGKGSVAYALTKLKQNYGLDVYYRGSKLFVGLAYTDSQAVNSETVYYNLQKNVINPQLNFRKIADVKIKVKAISILPDNTKIEAESGDADGALKTIHYYNLTTKAELQQQADETLKHLKYEGFEGSITTFGVPFCTHGQVADITDPRFDTRKGRHFIEKVVTTFGTGGFRRQVYLGKKAS